MATATVPLTVEPPDASEFPQPEWTALLIEGLTKPGFISAAYSAFHHYSVGNTLAAYWQCWLRQVPPGPLGTFNAWKERGRVVRKGERALWLCQPFTVKGGDRTRKPHFPAGASEEDATEGAFTVFKWRRAWFTLGQTDGNDYRPEPVGDWDPVRACTALDVTEEPFSDLDGNKQGYSYAARRVLTVSPLAEHPTKTLVHELAHIVLAHPEGGQHAHQEIEAELVALLCVEALGLPGADESRGYVQHYADRNHRNYTEGRMLLYWQPDAQQFPDHCEVDDRLAQRVFRAASAILKAGRPERAVPAGEESRE